MSRSRDRPQERRQTTVSSIWSNVPVSNLISWHFKNCNKYSITKSFLRKCTLNGLFPSKNNISASPFEEFSTWTITSNESKICLICFVVTFAEYNNYIKRCMIRVLRFGYSFVSLVRISYITSCLVRPVFYVCFSSASWVWLIGFCQNIQSITAILVAY